MDASETDVQLRAALVRGSTYLSRPGVRGPRLTSLLPLALRQGLGQRSQERRRSESNRTDEKLWEQAHQRDGLAGNWA